MDTTTNKTKIIFVITKSNFGGAQKYVYDLAVNLPKDIFDVAVALGGTGILIQKLREQNIRVIPITSLARDVHFINDVAALFELKSIFQNEKPDIVHLNSTKAGGIGALAARFAGVPKIIFTAHGWAFNEERPQWQRFLIKIFSWLIVILSHKTIAVSDAVKNNMQDWPFASNTISVIKNGISEPDFYSRSDAREFILSKTQNTISENAFIVGTIAELHKSKGLTYAIEAMVKLTKENSSLYYVVLGAGEEKEYLQTLIESHNLQERVFLLGFVDDAARYLPAFDLFLLPSITEGLALVLLEAGYAKLPVVASEVGGIPEVIENSKTGILVSARNPDVIVSAITQLYGSESTRNGLGVLLYKKISRDFSLERVIMQTQNLYNESVKKNDTRLE